MLYYFVSLLLGYQVLHGVSGWGTDEKWHNTDLLIKKK